MSWRARIWLAFAAVFWLAMTVVLWRSEFGSKRRLASSVPPGVVWKKMLTAPDYSTLEIRQGTNRIGNCRWRADVGQETATGARMMDEGDLIEGMVPRLAYYTVDFEGTVTLPDFPTRISFSLGLRLDTNFTWQSFETHVRPRPDVYEVIANAAAQTVQVRVDAGGDRFDHKFLFADFDNPQKLLQQFGGPLLPAMVGALGFPLSTNKLSAASLGLRWEASDESIVIGNNRVRAYRLQAKLLDRYKVAVFVSPVGEILRAELPDNIVLVNDQLAGLRSAADYD